MTVIKTRIEKRLQKKVNPRLRKLIISLKKQQKPFFLALAKELAKPRRKAAAVNLFKINKVANAGETVVVPGKVLSVGSLDKRLKIAAFSFSQKAEEKIKAASGEILQLEELLQKPQKSLRLVI